MRVERAAEGVLPVLQLVSCDLSQHSSSNSSWLPSNVWPTLQLLSSTMRKPCTRVPSEEHLEGQELICRRLFTPPSKPLLFNIGPFERQWSWVQPSPLPDRRSRGVQSRTTRSRWPSATASHAMKHPAWCCGTWFVLRSLSLAKVECLVWKIGTDHFFVCRQFWPVGFCQRAGVLRCLVGAPRRA